MKYPQYLASREWALKREAVRKRSGNKCERCKKAPQDAVHHLTYERVGNEHLEDLQAICDPCHEFLSGKSDYDPAYRHPAEIAAEEWDTYASTTLEANFNATLKTNSRYSECFHGHCPHCSWVLSGEGGEDHLRLLVKITETQLIFCDNCGKDIL